METNLTTDLRIEWWTEGVLVLTIDRPARRNTVDHKLLEGIAEAINANGGNAGAIVLRGAGGKAFSAGFDLNQLQGSDADLEADRAIAVAVEAITASPAPVVSMIQGHCHGAGAELRPSYRRRRPSAFAAGGLAGSRLPIRARVAPRAPRRPRSGFRPPSRD